MSFPTNLGLCLVSFLTVRAQSPGDLPGTGRWDFPRDLVTAQNTEMRLYFEGRIEQAARQRGRFWEGAGWSRVVERNRDELRRMIGAVDRFLPPAPKTKQIGAGPAFKYSLVEWPILRLTSASVNEYGILLESNRPNKHPAVVAIPDAHLSAADITGLTGRLPKREQYARSLAVNGYIVLVPFFTQRRTFSQSVDEDRAFLARLANQSGRHLIGSEVQQVSSAVDFLGKLARVDPERIGVVGSGQGGLIALYAAALDTRLKAVLAANYFDRREGVMDEPEDRILRNHLERFGDAEIAAMIAPRALVIDRGGAGAKDEFLRAIPFFEKANARAAIRFSSERDQQDGPSTAAIELFDEALYPDIQWPISPPHAPAAPELFFSIANAQFVQWQAHYRDQHSAKDNFDSLEGYPDATGQMVPKSLKLSDETGFTGYFISVRVYQEGVHAFGTLLVPKNIKPGERRAAVFAQVSADSKSARELVRQGYVVYAPQPSEDFRTLEKRARLVGLTLAGMDIRKAGRVLDYLKTLPFVDVGRFAYYGSGDAGKLGIPKLEWKPR